MTNFTGHLTNVLLMLITAGIAAPLARAQDAPAGCDGSTVDALGPKGAAAARAFLAELQEAVRKEDKQKVAGMIRYPMLYNPSDGQMKIRDRAEFLRKYSAILSPNVKEALAKQSSACLFGNYQGAMVGNGEIWFAAQKGGEWKVVTINDDSASIRDVK